MCGRCHNHPVSPLQEWTLDDGLLKTGGLCVVGCNVPEPSFPGATHLHPMVHFTPKHVSMQGALLAV